MEELNKLNRFELSKQGQRLPRELFIIIRDYSLAEIIAKKWAFDYLNSHWWMDSMNLNILLVQIIMVKHSQF